MLLFHFYDDNIFYDDLINASANECYVGLKKKNKQWEISRGTRQAVSY